MSLPWDRYGAEPTREPQSPLQDWERELLDPNYRAPGPVVSTPPEPVPPQPPPVPPPDPTPPVADSGTTNATDLVKADARSRSKRTLIQGLLFDLFAAVVASVALLAGADPFVKETWIGFGILLVKSVVSAGISYFMRLKNTPTARTKGEKYAIAPLPVARKN